MSGGRRRGKRKTFCQEKKKCICFVSFSRDCPEAAVPPVSQPSHVIHLRPQTLVAVIQPPYNCLGWLVQPTFCPVEIFKPAPPWVSAYSSEDSTGPGNSMCWQQTRVREVCLQLLFKSQDLAHEFLANKSWARHLYHSILKVKKKKKSLFAGLRNKWFKQNK